MSRFPGIERTQRRFILCSNRAISSLKDHAEHEMFRASLTLNSEGECRYRMAKGEDGTYEGEYFRWQVIHRALELLFFQE